VTAAWAEDEPELVQALAPSFPRVSEGVRVFYLVWMKEAGFLCVLQENWNCCRMLLLLPCHWQSSDKIACSHRNNRLFYFAEDISFRLSSLIYSQASFPPFLFIHSGASFNSRQRSPARDSIHATHCQATGRH